MENDIRDKLFAVIRTGMDQEAEPLDLSATDCKELIAIGARQSIQPIIFRGLKRLGAPESVIKECDMAQNRDLYQFVQHDYALEKISAALDLKQIPYILLKGAVLRNLYPVPELRTSCDIDVLVKETDLDKAVETIEAYTDLIAQQRNYHDISMTNSQVHLELHFSIRENMENTDRLLERVWEWASPSGNGSQYILTPEFQIFHIVTHMCYHVKDGGIGIRPFLDLWLLRTKTVFDEDTVRCMCSECNILKFYQICCDLANVWMQNEEHKEDTAVLESFCLSGGVFGTAENAAISKIRGKKNPVEYYLSRLFTSRTVLENLYPELKEKPYLLPICQVRRWTRLLNRQRWLEIKDEINHVKVASSESIDSYNELMKSLEL